MSQTKPSRPLSLVSFETMLREDLPPIDWLVEPLVEQGNRTVLFGEFGSMKSWLLLHLALHIAAGKPWFGRFKVPKARSVLYLDEEMSSRELRRRVRQIAAGAGLNDALPFRAVSQYGERFTEDSVEKLLAGLKAQRFMPDVIIVETLRRVLDGNENEAIDVSNFWQAVTPIFVAGKTLIVSHHMRKPNPQGGGEARYRASGSTDILAGADHAFAVSKKGDLITVECVKSRPAATPPPFRVRFTDLDGVDGQDRPVELRPEDAPGDSTPSEVDRALALLPGAFREAPELTAKTQEVIAYLKMQGFPKRTAERVLKTAWQRNILEKGGRGIWRLRPLEAAA